MASRLVLRRLRRFATLVIAAFAVFLASDQLEHHDLLCHLKTPQHCSACASSPVGADPHAPAWLHRVVLADAGGAVVAPVLLTGTVLPARQSGRSPPRG